MHVDDANRLEDRLERPQGAPGLLLGLSPLPIELLRPDITVEDRWREGWIAVCSH